MEILRIKLQTRLRDHLLSVDFGIGNELVALLGRDGAGKTEILRSIAGVYTPEHGTIEIGGREVFNAALAINLPPDERHAGWVPQISSLFPHETVADNVRFPFRRGYALHPHEAERRIDEILDLLQLSAIRNRRLAELDPRAQHAAAVGRALVTDPEVLLLDQPFRQLDVATQRKVRHDLQLIRRMIGVPTLFATTDLEEAYEIADRIALLDRGRLLQVAPPRTLVTRPRNREVAELVRSVNIFPGRILGTFEGGVDVETPIGTLQVDGAWQTQGPVEVVIRPEHIRILGEGDRAPAGANILPGELIEDTSYGPLHAVSFRPDGADPGSVLEISVSDLLFRQLELGSLGRRDVVLPSHAIHLMEPAVESDETDWLGARHPPTDEDIII